MTHYVCQQTPTSVIPIFGPLYPHEVVAIIVAQPHQIAITLCNCSRNELHRGGFPINRKGEAALAKVLSDALENGVVERLSLDKPISVTNPTGTASMLVTFKGQTTIRPPFNARRGSL